MERDWNVLCKCYLLGKNEQALISAHVLHATWKVSLTWPDVCGIAGVVMVRVKLFLLRELIWSVVCSPQALGQEAHAEQTIAGCRIFIKAIFSIFSKPCISVLY